MKKTLAAAGLAGAVLTAAGASRAKTYLEFAVYRVKEPAAFSTLREEAAEILPQVAPGLIWWKRLKSQEGLFADVAAWSSPEQAKAAAEIFEQEPRFQPMKAAIQSMEHFAHYWAAGQADHLGATLDAAPLVEIALYRVKDAALHQDVQDDLYGRLQRQDGMLGGVPLVADGIERGFGDLLTWRDLESWEQTGKAMMAVPDLKPFFEGLEQSNVFAVFTRDGAE